MTIVATTTTTWSNDKVPRLTVSLFRECDPIVENVETSNSGCFLQSKGE